VKNARNPLRPRVVRASGWWSADRIARVSEPGTRAHFSGCAREPVSLRRFEVERGTRVVASVNGRYRVTAGSLAEAARGGVRRGSMAGRRRTC